jgi:GNAT superfamily N-acetyltransferase
MCDEWMPVIKLPMTVEEFRQVPRNPAYKYEYLEGQLWLSPRPRHYHALLDLEAQAVPLDVPMRGVQEADWADLQPVFAGAFQYIQPFGSLDEATRRQAARQALERTRTGGDGPWIEPASFVALSPGEGADGPPGPPLQGAIFTTLLPGGDPCDWDSYYWREPPPADCLARRLGQPHLTWIFTAPAAAGQGLGTALLAMAVNALLGLGYTQLLSTFMLGNESSMLWHWRNGFRLLAYPGSQRRWRRPLRPAR